MAQWVPVFLSSSENMQYCKFCLIATLVAAYLCLSSHFVKASLNLREENEQKNVSQSLKSESLHQKTSLEDEGKNAKQYYLEALQLEEDGKLNEAVKSLKKAAKQGHGRAAYFVAHRYFDGKGVCQSNQKGIQYLTIAKNNGCVEAEQELSFKHAENICTKKPQKDFGNDKTQFHKNLRIVGERAKELDSVSWYVQYGSDIGSALLYVLGYEKISLGLEKLSLASKFVGGASKVTYGVTDTVLTGDKKHLLSTASGLIQVGSSYLQYEARAKYNKLKIEKVSLEEQKRLNDKQLEIIVQQKTEIEERLKKCENGVEDCKEEFSKLEEVWEDVTKKQQEYLDKHSLITKQQKECSFQTLGIECTEEVCDRTFTDIRNNEFTVQEALFKNIKHVAVNGVRKFCSETMKENKEEIRNILYALFDNIKGNLMKTKIVELITSVDKNLDDKNILTSMIVEIGI